MQDIWRSGVDWDDPLPPALLEVWNDGSPTFPRSQLHVFTDASELGFVACVFLRAS